MTTNTPASIAGLDYRRFLDCVHCGLCTSACPTYLELGTEMDGPRGRIHLMRAVADGRLSLDEDVLRHLDLCLDCRACETACPSGVEYSRLLEPFRVFMEKERPKDRRRELLLRFFVFPLASNPGRLGALLRPLRLLERLGILRWFSGSGLFRLLPKPLRALYGALPPLGPELPPLPEFLPAKGRKRATVALLTGCVADVLFRRVHWASARVLQENGCEVWVPAPQGCCGALYLHAGAIEPAVRAAQRSAHLLDPGRVDAILSNVAGCGAMLKEYPRLPLPEDERERVGRFSQKVRDISEFLWELGIIPPRKELPVRAAYHDACHLAQAQGIEEAPRRLLQMIPGLSLVPLEESAICCGAAGAYSLLEREMADRLATRKAGFVEKTGARALFAANAGCLLHMGQKLRERGDDLWLAHPMEALDRSYRGG